MEPLACSAVLFGALLFSGGAPSLSDEDDGEEGVCVEYVCYVLEATLACVVDVRVG